MAAWEVLALQTAVRLGDRRAAARLAELVTLVNGPRVRIAAAHAVADAHALHTVSAQLEQMGDLLTATDAAAQAATAHARANRAELARANTARAHLLAHRCQGARTPAIVAVGRPLPVTAREQEIITLTGRGLSNRDIAQQLGCRCAPWRGTSTGLAPNSA